MAWRSSNSASVMNMHMLVRAVDGAAAVAPGPAEFRAHEVGLLVFLMGPVLAREEGPQYRVGEQFFVEPAVHPLQALPAADGFEKRLTGQKRLAGR